MIWGNSVLVTRFYCLWICEIQQKFYRKDVLTTLYFRYTLVVSVTQNFIFLQKNFAPAFTLGAGRQERVTMVIGIPSVKRPAVDYLSNTLKSIFGAMYPVNEDDVAVVVFLAETDDEFLKSEMQYVCVDTDSSCIFSSQQAYSSLCLFVLTVQVFLCACIPCIDYLLAIATHLLFHSLSFWMPQLH